MLENNFRAKIIRTITSILPIDKKRKGNCANCGKCCKLPKKCKFLKTKDGKSYCSIYKIRPLNCRKYPRAETEFLTENTCGFYFESK